MPSWTIHFHGENERATLAKADLFFIQNKDSLGLTRGEFFARLVMSEDGRVAEFIGQGERPFGVVPDETAGPGPRPHGVVYTPAPSEVYEADHDLERPASGPESAASEDAV